MLDPRTPLQIACCNLHGARRMRCERSRGFTGFETVARIDVRVRMHRCVRARGCVHVRVRAALNPAGKRSGGGGMSLPQMARQEAMRCMHQRVAHAHKYIRPFTAARRSRRRQPHACAVHTRMRSSTGADRGHSGTQCPADHVAGVCPEAHRRLDPLLVPAVLVHRRLRLRRSRVPRVLVPLNLFPLTASARLPKPVPA